MDPARDEAESASRRDPRFPQLIVGLGNPGERYERTRHNAGFLVLEHLRRQADRPWVGHGDWDQVVVPVAGRERILVRPLTYMNRSGQPLLHAMEAARCFPEDLLVVVDDVYLPIGRLRVRRQGSPGGHNGLVSICDSLGTQSIVRLKVGVGPVDPGADLAEFVLDPLEGDAWLAFDAAVAQAAEAAELVCADGIDAAMNRFHAPPAPGDEAS